MHPKTIHRNQMSSDDDPRGGTATSVMTVLATVLFALLIAAVIYFSQAAMQ